MKGICKNNRNYENRLIVGKQYEIEYDYCDVDGVYVWFIGEDGKRWVCYANRFEIVKENVMKIKKWEDLKDVKVGNKIVHYCHGCIDIRKENCSMINSFAIENYTTEELIGILKAIGLDIEFIKEPKLTKEEFIILDSLECSEDKIVSKFDKNPYIRASHTNVTLKQSLFQFIKAGESWKVEELLKLEVEE